MDELMQARIVSIALAESRSTRDCHHRSLPSQASAAKGRADLRLRLRTFRTPIRLARSEHRPECSDKANLCFSSTRSLGNGDRMTEE
jgi:hypothetical protein